MHLAHMVLDYGDDEMQLEIGAIEAGICFQEGAAFGTGRRKRPVPSLRH